MTESTPEDSLLGSSVFGAYRITEKLGEGAMGAVYLAQRDDLDQKVALKVLHERALSDPETVERFRREGRVIAMLSHPNVVRVFIHGEKNGHPYMAMEFVEGSAVSTILGSGALAERRVARIAQQLCSALAEAHDLGILHRDIKPENILLTTYRGEQDFAKMLDFGLAKMSNSNSQLTQSGIVYGTPAYMSPEQAQAHDLDGRSDVYSLGCTLYHMITGDVPFDAKTAIRILEMQVFQAPRPPGELATVSPEFEEIILRAMEKKPEDRWQTAAEMLEAIEALPSLNTAPVAASAGVDWLPVEKLNALARSESLFWPALLGVLFGTIFLCVVLVVTLLVVVV